MRRGRFLLAGGAALLVLGPSLAHAADEIGLSADGSSWSAGLDDPLFDPDVRWVPGDSRTASFFVRNQGPSGAAMTIEARSADRDQLIADDDIDLRARADGGEWVDLRNGVASRRLTDRAITRGGVVRVDVNAVFDPASTNQSQVKRLALDFSVALADAAGSGGGADADGGADGDGGGPGSGDTPAALPDTGAGTTRTVVLVALAAVVGGIGALGVPGRKEKRTP